MVKIGKIAQKDAYHFTILWSDGRESLYRLSALQLACPCAQCSGKRQRGNPPVVRDDLSAQRIVSVGRYALRVEFSAGCSEGIYPFPLLRKLDRGRK